jgi:hypothetical protein
MVLTLVDVEERGTPEGGAPQFSVNFTGQANPYLPQGTYRFEHNGETAFDLFIVPLGPDAAGTVMRYEAAFS